MHAVLLNGGVEGPRPFQEGLATLVGRPFTDYLSERDLLEVLHNWNGDARDYYMMALFCHYLIQEYGAPRVVDFLASTFLEDSVAQYSGEFEEVFDRTLEEVVSDFESYPRCSHWLNAKEILSCGESSSQWHDGQWSLDIALSCANQDVYGPDEVGRILTDRTLVVDNSGEYGFYGVASGANPQVSVFVRKCGSCVDSKIFRIQAAPVGAVTKSLTPGTYHLVFTSALEDGPTDIQFVVERLM